MATKKWFGLAAVLAAFTGLVARLLGKKRATRDSEPEEEALEEDLEDAETD